MSALRVPMAVFLLAGMSGCFVHERIALLPEVVEPCRAMHGDCRNKVYVVLLHGFDPMDFNALESLRDSLNGVGFARTFCGQWYHAGDFAEEIIRRRAVEPDARVVIVGSGLGVEPAHEMAERLGRSGIEVAALYGIDPPFWSSRAYTKPANVDHVRFLRKTGAWSIGSDDDADVIDVDSSTWTALAAQPDVATAVIEEVAQQAGQITHRPSRIGQLAYADPIPTPRRVTIARGGSNDAWDFLRPVAKLAAPGNGSRTEWTTAKPNDQ